MEPASLYCVYGMTTALAKDRYHVPSFFAPFPSLDVYPNHILSLDNQRTHSEVFAD